MSMLTKIMRKSITSAIVAIFVGLLVASIILVVAGYDPISSFEALIGGMIGKPKYISNVIIKATPLLFTGIAVAFAFRVGLFNIGAEGQYIVGTILAVIVGYSLDLPPVLQIPVVVLVGTAGAAGVLIGLYYNSIEPLMGMTPGIKAFVAAVLGGIGIIPGAALGGFVNKLIGGDSIAIGHFNCIGYAFSGYVGKLFAKKNEEDGDKEAKELPEFFKLFKDFVFSVALFMIVLFYVVTIACLVTGHFGDTLANNKPFTSYFGNDVWWIWPFLAGLQFAAGMSVLVYGVRQFIAEITAAFVGISERLIPDARPAVDCPAVFPFAPNAVIIGFIGSFLGGLVAMALMVAFHSPTIMIPAAGICFFSGGTCGVCGYAYGGWRGALLGSFLVGIFLTAGPLILYPAFAQLGIAEASFPNVDYNIVGSIIYGIGSLFGLA